jgi:hypothetical protein
MGQFLDEDAADRLGGVLKDVADGNEPAPQSEDIETQSSEPAEGVTEEAEEKVESSPEPDESSDDSEKQEEEEGEGSMHRVPYNRFKSVIDARNQYRSEADALKAQIEELKRQNAEPRQVPAQKPSQAPQDDDFWNIDDDEATAPTDRRYSDLEGRLNQMAIYQAEQQLEREIHVVQKSYPGVPRELLLQAVVLDGSSDLQRIAENYSSHIASVEEGAIARHMESIKGKREVPPRTPRAASEAPSTSSKGQERPRPATVSEASRALAEFLKRENPFSI